MQNFFTLHVTMSLVINSKLPLLPTRLVVTIDAGSKLGLVWRVPSFSSPSYPVPSPPSPLFSLPSFPSLPLLLLPFPFPAPVPLLLEVHVGPLYSSSGMGERCKQLLDSRPLPKLLREIVLFVIQLFSVDFAATHVPLSCTVVSSVIWYWPQLMLYSWERYKLPQRDLGWSPSQNWFWCILA